MFQRQIWLFFALKHHFLAYDLWYNLRHILVLKSVHYRNVVYPVYNITLSYNIIKTMVSDPNVLMTVSRPFPPRLIN